MMRGRGFSLIEMAFVLVIVTLLLGGLLVPFATQVEQRRITETQKGMEEIKEALIGFALSHVSGNPSRPYLPCPDTDNNGEENFDLASGLCTNEEGLLPWVTLGLGNQDAWGNRFFYRVTGEFANRAPAANPGFNLDSSGNLRICSRSPTLPAALCNPIASAIPAVVISFGKNSRGAMNINNAVANPAPAGADERENSGAGAATDFVSRVLTAPSIPCDGAGEALCEFDDLVVWLSPNILFNRMVAAGKLP